MQLLTLLAAFDVKWLIPVGCVIAAIYFFTLARKKDSKYFLFSLALTIAAILVTIMMYGER